MLALVARIFGYRSVMGNTQPEDILEVDFNADKVWSSGDGTVDNGRRSPAALRLGFLRW